MKRLTTKEFSALVKSDKISYLDSYLFLDKNENFVTIFKRNCYGELSYTKYAKDFTIFYEQIGTQKYIFKENSLTHKSMLDKAKEIKAKYCTKNIDDNFIYQW